METTESKRAENPQFTEDVMRAARSVAADFYENEVGTRGDVADGIANEMRQGLRDDAGSIQVAARAIVAERARCALMAEGWPTPSGDTEYQTNGTQSFWDAGTNYDQGRIDAAADIRSPAAVDLLARATDAKPSVQQAAQTMLDVWNRGIRSEDRDKGPAFRLLAAACSGAAAYDQAMDQGAAPSAMVRAFLTAAINPNDPELDRLRTNAAQRDDPDDPVVETIGLYEGDSAAVLRDPPGNVTTYGPQAHTLMNAIMACMGESDEPASPNHPIEHYRESEQGAG